MPPSKACVLNLKDNWSTRNVHRVDRTSRWGNPFKIGRDGSRDDVLVEHEKLLRENPEMVNEIWHLRNKPLGCWCEPLPCHGWLLAFLANGEWEDVFAWMLGTPFWTEARLRSRSVPGAPGWKR